MTLAMREMLAMPGGEDNLTALEYLVYEGTAAVP